MVNMKNNALLPIIAVRLLHMPHRGFPLQLFYNLLPGKTSLCLSHVIWIIQFSKLILSHLVFPLVWCIILVCPQKPALPSHTLGTEARMETPWEKELSFIHCKVFLGFFQHIKHPEMWQRANKYLPSEELAWGYSYTFLLVNHGQTSNLG